MYKSVDFVHSYPISHIVMSILLLKTVITSVHIVTIHYLSHRENDYIMWLLLFFHGDINTVPCVYIEYHIYTGPLWANVYTFIAWKHTHKTTWTVHYSGVNRLIKIVNWCYSKSCERIKTQTDYCCNNINQKVCR